MPMRVSPHGRERACGSGRASQRCARRPIGRAARRSPCARARHRHRNLDAGGLTDPLARIGKVGEGAGEEGPWSARGSQQRYTTMAVMKVCRRDRGHEHPPVRVGHDVTLTSDHAPRRVEAAFP